MYKLIVGNISSERQIDWFRKDETPYAVWEGTAIAEETCIGSTWVTADEMLRDHVDVDWGSIAWRANKAELIRFFEVCELNISSLKQLEPAKDYAVVFIETVWGDSA